jgi:hypothetical protein
MDSMVMDTQYYVIGRYMVGTSVSAYHLVGENGRQLKVSKAVLIAMTEQGIITNCRVQSYNNNKILRGNGVNLNELPVYDESKNSVKVKQTGANKKNISVYYITKEFIKNDKAIGYEVKCPNGEHKKYRKSDIVELILDNKVGNAKIINNRIVFDREIQREIINTVPEVIIDLQDLAEMGKRRLTLKDSDNASIGIKDIKSGNARIYIQTVDLKVSELRVSEFITSVLKFGKDRGVVMRVVRRDDGDTVDIKEPNIALSKLNDKILIGIMCCGVKKKYGIDNFYAASIQSKDSLIDKRYVFS